MPQQAVRFSDELHAAIKAEAARRGRPHSFSSVLVEWAAVGRERALEAALSEGIASEPRPGTSRANGSEGRADAPSAAASLRTPVPGPVDRQSAAMARQRKLNAAKGGKA